MGYVILNMACHVTFNNQLENKHLAKMPPLANPPNDGSRRHELIK